MKRLLLLGALALIPADSEAGCGLFGRRTRPACQAPAVVATVEAPCPAAMIRHVTVYQPWDAPIPAAMPVTDVALPRIAPAGIGCPNGNCPAPRGIDRWRGY